jgi:RNA ligase (TIGR02306 family)
MRKLVAIEKIQEKKPIDGADRIEAVRVRDWWVVAKKDEFEINDTCLYYEIDSFLPVKPEYEFLLKGSKPKKMLVDGKEQEGIRLRSVKLRGQLSQGLVLPVWEGLPIEIGTDVTELLGVIKYEAPIPPELSGKVKGSFPSFIPKTDEERIQNISEVLSSFYVTEKLDGSSTTLYKKNGVFGVCSRNLELAEGETTQWRLAKQYDLVNNLPDNFAIQCELIGEGIQKNPLKQKGQDIYCFSVYNIKAGIYLGFKDFIGFCASLGVKTVPIINENYALPALVEELLTHAEGKSKLNENEQREGIVIRPKVEMQYKGQRFSFKAISNAYLLKTES